MVTWVIIPKKEALKAELESESLWPPGVCDLFLFVAEKVVGKILT